jgi:hypothetical protein
MLRLRIALLCGLCCGVASVAQSPGKRTSSAPDPGTVTTGTYRNSSLGISYKGIYGWVDRTRQMSQDATANKGEVLLALFERPPEATASTVNSAVIIATEKISAYPGMTSAAQYFEPLTAATMAGGFKVANEPYPVTLGAKSLIRGDFKKDLPAYQSSLVMLARGYVVSFTFIGENEEEVEKLIGGLSFLAPRSH